MAHGREAARSAARYWLMRRPGSEGRRALTSACAAAQRMCRPHACAVPLRRPGAAPSCCADFSVAAQRSYELEGFAFLHDFAMTENYYLVFQNPVTGEQGRGAATRTSTPASQGMAASRSGCASGPCSPLCLAGACMHPWCPTASRTAHTFHLPRHALAPARSGQPALHLGPRTRRRLRALGGGPPHDSASHPPPGKDGCPGADMPVAPKR